jgi:hypothetical protein
MAVIGVAAAPAAAKPAKPFGKLTCVPREGTRFCEGSVATRVPSFDGVPLDVNVTLPASGDGPWPLIIGFHGFGSHKRGFEDAPPDHEGPKRLAQRGYIVLNPQARGFWASCGTADSRAADPAGCAKGWVHLDDMRYEVRDAQYLAGLLVDEGLADPQRIGAWADSYGGEPSLALGLLRDRMMLGALPGEPDKKLVPWTSPKGRPMRIRAVAPYQTWSDLPEALLPNGRVLDYVQPGPDDSIHPLGVSKETFVAGLYGTGQAGTSGVMGYFSPPGADPQSDMGSWTARLSAGEPYDGDPVAEGYVETVRATRSPDLIPLDRQPAPMLIGNGWSDDLFGIDQMLRIRSEVQARWPRTPIGVYLADYGHQRTGNEKADMIERNAWIFRFFDHYIRGIGPRPYLGFRARAVTCPVGNGSGPLHQSPTWATLHPGEVRFRAPGPVTVLSSGGDQSVAAAYTPVTANDPCKTVAASDAGEGTATYRLPPATGPGYTLMGTPTVIASLTATGDYPELASRLWDVAPDGTQLLIVRGVLRPRATGKPEPFQLSPAGWHVAAGHVIKLELLGQDSPHFRASNGTFSIEVRDLELRLPVAERPGSAPGVETPAAPVMPDGAVAAADLAPPPTKRPRPTVHVTYPNGRRHCGARTVRISVAGPGITRIDIRRGSHRLARDGTGPFSIRLSRTRAIGLRASATLVVRISLHTGAAATRHVRVRFCGKR